MNSLAVVLGAIVPIILAPYLARLTRSVPDDDRRDWWRGSPVRRRRMVACALVGAVVGGLAGYGARWSPVLPAVLVLAVVVTPLVIIDLECHRLPNRLVFTADALFGAGLLVASGLGGSHRWSAGLRALEAGALVFAIFYAICFLAPGAFGYGDTKLLAPLAAALGWFGWAEVYYGILAGFVLGAVAGMGAIAFRGANRKTRIPFGPALVLGAFLVVAWHRSL